MLPKRSGVALNIAHRGARSLAPENTLTAASKALAVGADLWEFDVQWTQDRELVVIHDDTLERTTNAKSVFPGRSPWRVEAFTLAQIKRLDAGSWFDEQDPFGQIAAEAVSTAERRSYQNVAVPTLGEALGWTRAHHWYANVELKPLQGDAIQIETFVEQVVRCIEASDMVERVLVSSFDIKLLQACGRLAPLLARALLVERAPAQALALLERLAVQAYHPHHNAYGPSLARALGERGLAVNVWGDHVCANQALLSDPGVNGIFTDYPQHLAGLLGGRNPKGRNPKGRNPKGRNR